MRIALVLVAACSTALAADEDPVKAPYLEKGDCWTYRAQGLAYRPASHEYEYCITLIDTSKKLVLGIVTLKDDGREFDTVHTLEWTLHASHSGLISSDGFKPYKFPLKVGDSYSTKFEFKDTRYGQNAGEARYDIKVVGWEDVTVPAGTFRALKVEGSGSVRRYDQQLQFPHWFTAWYSPKVNRSVKLEYRNPGRSSSEELTGYRLNQ